MLKYKRLATVVPVVFLCSITSCSSVEPSQDTSSTSKSPEVSTATRQTNSSAVMPEVALANHLKQIGAKFYGAFWCPYCKKQKEMFSQEAFSQVNYIECDSQGKNPQPALCQEANISSFPTWEIKGQHYQGLRSLQELADLSGYKGDRNFSN